jgi:hypothetical protein
LKSKSTSANVTVVEHALTIAPYVFMKSWMESQKP